MTTVSIQEAEANFSEMIQKLKAGEEIVITENNQPVACLLPVPVREQKKSRQSGTLKGSVVYMAPDFDAPLEDFEEYT